MTRSEGTSPAHVLLAPGQLSPELRRILLQRLDLQVLGDGLLRQLSKLRVPAGSQRGRLFPEPGQEGSWEWVRFLCEVSHPAQTLALAHTLAQTLALAHSLAQTLGLAHTHTHTLALEHAHAHLHSHPHTRTRTHLHSHMRTRIHTHTRTRTRASGSCCRLCRLHTRVHTRETSPPRGADGPPHTPQRPAEPCDEAACAWLSSRPPPRLAQHSTWTFSTYFQTE